MKSWYWHRLFLVFLVFFLVMGITKRESMPEFVEKKIQEEEPDYGVDYSRPFGWGTGWYVSPLLPQKQDKFFWFASSNSDGFLRVFLDIKFLKEDLSSIQLVGDSLVSIWSIEENKDGFSIGLANNWMERHSRADEPFIDSELYYHDEAVLDEVVEMITRKFPFLQEMEVVKYLYPN